MPHITDFDVFLLEIETREHEEQEVHFKIGDVTLRYDIVLISFMVPVQ